MSSIRHSGALTATILPLLPLVLLPEAAAQYVQQGKLIGYGAVGSAQMGFSAGLSADGNTAIVGGPEDNDTAGATWVFTRSQGSWSQQGGKLVGSGAVGKAYQGISAALSADGNTAIIGGERDNNLTGAAWVFTRTGGVWTQQGGKLVGTGAVGSASQGRSVALSADGNTAILGGPGDSPAGAAWVFTRSGGVWSQQGAKLVGSGAVGCCQGGSVALSADGTTAILGAGGDNDLAGAIWVFTRSGGVWTQQGAKLVGSGAIDSAIQGASVALSADGNTAVVGAPFDNKYRSPGFGAAWVFARAGGVWRQQGGKLIVAAPAAGESFQIGFYVTLSGDGNTAIVGGNASGFQAGSGAGISSGAGWVFRRSAGAWTQQGAKLVGSGATESYNEIGSLALSADASTAIIGGYRDGRDLGAAWVFAPPAVPPIPLPSVAAGGVVNGASFLRGIAPGTWITIQGENLASTTRSWTGSDFSGSNLPTQLDGVSVAVNGNPAYVDYISPTQLNVLTPADTRLGSVPVQVTNALGKSSMVNATESAFAPALFTFTAQTIQYAAAVRADGAYLGPSLPARPGDIILLYGTGFGPTSPPGPIGQLINSAPLANPVTVRIGGVTAVVQFAGIVSPGLYQFNVVVPNVPKGDNRVFIQIGGIFSQTDVFLSIQE